MNVIVIIDRVSRTAVALNGIKTIRKWSGLTDPIEKRIQHWADTWGYIIEEIRYVR